MEEESTHMNFLPETNSMVGIEERQLYFDWVERVKKVLFNDPTIGEIIEIKRKIKHRASNLDYKVGELESYIQSHPSQNNNNLNEESLKRTYEGLRDALNHLHKHINTIKISQIDKRKTLEDELEYLEKENEILKRKVLQLEEKQPFYQILWNWIKPKYI